MLSRASFEGIVRPSTLHFIKLRSKRCPFGVAAEDDAATVSILVPQFYDRSPADIMAHLARASPAPLDAALEPLADCVTELLIDVAETRSQIFPYGFGSLRSLRRLAIRLLAPGVSPTILSQLDLSAFSKPHGGTLTSLDASGFVNRKLTASPPFSALRRLVMRGMRSPRGDGPPPFRLPTQSGGFAELEFLAAGFEGHRPARLQFSDRDWFARFCALQSRQAQGECYFWFVFLQNFQKNSFSHMARPAPRLPPPKKNFF